MKKYVNEYTGEVNIQTEAEFISMSKEPMKNSNEKNYKVATVKIVTENGEEKQVSAIVHEGNYAHEDANFKPGNKYLANIAPGDERGSILSLSHLPANERVSDEDFDFSEVEEKVEQNEDLSV